MAGQISKEKRQQVFNKYNGKCAYCGCDLKLNSFHVDHIEAKFRGTPQEYLKRIKGSDKLENFNPSCPSCNSSKSTFQIEDWRKELCLKLKRLHRDNSSYRIALRFGMIEEKETKVLFYFEKHS